MNKEQELMELFTVVEDRGKHLAPVSPQNWEAVLMRLRAAFSTLHEISSGIATKAVALRDPDVDAGIHCQCVLLTLIEMSVDLLPVGKSDDFADFHQERLRNQFSKWAKETGSLVELMRLSKHENRTAH